MRVGHPGGASVVVPDDWHLTEVAPSSVVALEPPGRSSFRTNVVLMARAVGPDTAESWASDTDRLADVLRDHVLLDEDETALGGRLARIRLVHHTGPAGEALVMKQWSVAAGDVAWTLTATIDTPRWSASAAALEEIAASFAMPGGQP